MLVTKLSIIIPYYNTYDYTIKLLKELEMQYVPGVEVILVDDGCNEKRFDQFTFAKIIHLPENKGASHAWNVGIKEAVGDYIAFIDSDDMITMDYISSLLNMINKYNYDVIKFDWYDTYFNVLIQEPKNRGIWKAIYRRNIVPLFHEDWYYNTDVPFQEDLKNTPHTECYVNKLLYFYNSKREGSITWKKRKGLLQKHKNELLKGGK